MILLIQGTENRPIHRHGKNRGSLRLWGEENGELLGFEQRVYIGDDEMEMNNGAGCTTI